MSDACALCRLLVAVAMIAPAANLASQPPPPVIVQETWPDGSVKERYAVDQQGRKHGVYEAFAANGTRTLLAHYAQGRRQGAYREWSEDGRKVRSLVYRDDLLHGLSQEFHDNGRSKSVGEYRQGLRDGKWLEQDESGERKRNAEYRAGKLHGTLRVTHKSKVLTKQQWRNGELLELDGMQPFPLPRERLCQELRAILAAAPGPADPRDPLALDRRHALRRLQAYRHLCGLPWADLVLVAEWNLRCDAAAEVCSRLGRLEHEPQRPAGMDEARYQLGAEGARKSNLHRGVGLAESVDGYMDDSDPSNIDEVGHRRWCLNPLMKRTGFGSHQTFNAMWATDESGAEPKGLDAVYYPPRGFVPVDLFATKSAFSIALAPGRDPHSHQLRVALHALDDDFLPVGKPLPLDHCAIAAAGFGRGACVIFRSPEVVVASGKRYLVEVSLDGGKSIAHRYVVEFCARTADAAEGK